MLGERNHQRHQGFCAIRVGRATLEASGQLWGARGGALGRVGGHGCTRTTRGFVIVHPAASSQQSVHGSTTPSRALQRSGQVRCCETESC